MQSHYEGELFANLSELTLTASHPKVKPVYLPIGSNFCRIVESQFEFENRAPEFGNFDIHVCRGGLIRVPIREVSRINLGEEEAKDDGNGPPRPHQFGDLGFNGGRPALGLNQDPDQERNQNDRAIWALQPPP